MDKSTAKPEDYIYLKKGEIIEYGDECMLPNCEWFTPYFSLVLGMEYDPQFMLPHRRLIKVELKDLF